MSYEKLQDQKVFDTKHRQYFETYLKNGTANHYEYEVVYLRCLNPYFYLQDLQFQKTTFISLLQKKQIVLS